MIHRFVMRMCAELPQPDGLICMIAWIALCSLFSKEAWRSE